MFTPTLLALVTSLSSAPWTPAEPTWADLDGDGRSDLLFITEGGELRVLLSDPSGRLTPAEMGWSAQDLGALLDLAVSDFDGDGREDIAVLDAAGTAHLLWNSGAGLDDVTVGSGLGELSASRAVRWFDYDEDGRPDLFLEGAAGAPALARNLGQGAFESIPLAQPSALAPNPITSYATPVKDNPEEAKAAGAGDAAVAPRERLAPALGYPSQGTLSGGSVVVPTDPAGPLPAALACVPSIADAAGGACLPASSTPLLGHLLPLGDDLFVSPTGSVGLGTLDPLADLHVSGGFFGSLRISSYNPFPDDFASTIELGTHSFDEGMLLDARKAGLNIYSRRLSQGGPITVGPHLSVLRQDQTAVGIGTDTPATTLDVDGQATVRDDFHWRRTDGLQTALLEPERFAGSGSRLSLFQGNGTIGARLDGQQNSSGGGAMTLFQADGFAGIELDADSVGGGWIRLTKADHSVGIVIDADANGEARITTEVLEITGGADLVESFDTGTDECPPGSVLVIDAQRAGELALAREPYDRRVAGIVSGAGGVQPGLRMGQDGVADGSTPVALTGRVFVRCNAESGPVQPGDLLTTSSTAGEAMRAADAQRSGGAVIGKAMTPLDGERGLVLVLVSLQ